MSQELEDLFRDLHDSVYQLVLEEVELLDADASDERELVETIQNLFFAPPQQYQLKNGLVILYLLELLQPTTTETQWRLGRALLNQFAEPILRKLNPMGPPIKIFDRIFQCIHVEWCIETSEIGTTDAIRRTVECMDASETQLRRWYRLGKEGRGEAATERAAARLVIQLVEQINDFVIGKGPEELFTDDLLERINNFEDPAPQ